MRVGRVLAVDGEPMVQEFLGAVAERMGHEVELARPGADAVRRLLGKEWGFVVFDIGLGAPRDLDRVRLARLLAPRACFIATGAAGLEGETTEWLSSNGMVVLEKPFDLGALRALLSGT